MTEEGKPTWPIATVLSVIATGAHFWVLVWILREPLYYGVGGICCFVAIGAALSCWCPPRRKGGIVLTLLLTLVNGAMLAYYVSTR